MINLVIAALAAGSNIAAEQGSWRTADGSAYVEVARCGPNLCGTVRWVRDAALRDVHNPDQALRSRSLAGAVVIQDVGRSGNRWSGGRLYVPRTGRSYPARLTLEQPNRLLVQGCRFGLCRGERWTRIR